MTTTFPNSTEADSGKACLTAFSPLSRGDSIDVGGIRGRPSRKRCVVPDRQVLYRGSYLPEGSLTRLPLSQGAGRACQRSPVGTLRDRSPTTVEDTCYID